MEKTIVFWNDFKRYSSDLAQSILTSGIKYDAIYGIPRGGIAVAVELSNLLNLPLISEPRKNTLVVDDIVDNGMTILNYKEFDTASLFVKEKSSVVPTYYVNKIADEWVVFPWEVTKENKDEGIENNIIRILEYIGEDPSREGLLETPKRVAKAYGEWFSGYNKNPEDIMKTFTSSNNDQIVVVSNIDFYSYCEHHLAPFYGQAHIGYIPDGKVLGVSKFSRLIDIYARRLQVQENLTAQIADAIMKYLKPQGVGVIVEGIHLCMRSRGVQKQNSIMTTSVMLGAFREKEGVRQEFLKLCKYGKN